MENMFNTFFTRLAMNNLVNNRRFYLPYMIASSVMICLFFCIHAIYESIKKTDMFGAYQSAAILVLGIYVVGIFSVIFLFYTNSFLIKRRKKEIGLFNILGMEKRHIGRILFNESCMVTGICLVAGIGLGVLLYRLIFLVLLKVLQIEVPIKSSLSWISVQWTCILFILIFLATLIWNLGHIHLSKPIELLKGGQTGEKEPKSKWLLTLIGLCSVGTGYYIAITVESPLRAISLFFIAAILVIVGTYCLFTAGSILLLKILRKNKKYYYKTSHFVSVSSLIYRMKQNAVGLANISILCSAVLLMLSSTLSLYMGLEDVLENRYPAEINIRVENLDEANKHVLEDNIKELAEIHDVMIKNVLTFGDLTLVFGQNEAMFSLLTQTYSNDDNHSVLTFITLDAYNQLTSSTKHLEANECLLFTTNESYVYNQISLNSEKASFMFDIKEEIETLPLMDKSNMPIAPVYYLVLSDDAQIIETFNTLREENRSALDLNYTFDLDGDDKELEATYFTDLKIRLQAAFGEDISIESREENRVWLIGIFGGLLFLGIFLGVVFLIATVLIIYYKQISEGYDDRGRFDVLQKVGMSQKEIQATIKSQIRLIFYLPLVTAIIHIGVAFKMVVRLLAVLQLYDVPRFLVSTLLTMFLFALVYMGVYHWTAKVYYRIVRY